MMESEENIEETNTTQTVNNFIMPWWQQFVFITAYVLIILVAAGGNLIVIWIVLAHKRMRTFTNYFLVNLATADTLISIFNTLFTSTYLMYQDWWYGDAYCKFTNFISVCTIAASVLTFMAIAIDRYTAIIYPLRPRVTQRVIFAIFVIWLVSIVVAFPNLIYATVVSVPNQTTRQACLLLWPDGYGEKTELAYSMIFLGVTYILPLVTLTVTYTRIGKELWGSRAIGEDTPVQYERIRSKRRVVKMMIVVVTIFAICWLPYHIYFILASILPISNYAYIQQVYLVIYWLAMSNSMYNPIIYCWMNSKFRHGFVQVFCCCPCRQCKRVKNKPKPDTIETMQYDSLIQRNGTKRVHFGRQTLLTNSHYRL